MGDPLTTALEHLAVSGVTGTITVLFILLFLAKDKALQKCQKDHAEEMARVREECKDELAAEKQARIEDAKATTTIAIQMHDKAHTVFTALLEVTKEATKKSPRVQ